MRIAYFDCFAGASGNMILGGLIDAGLDLDALVRELRRLPVTGWTMSARPVSKLGIGALYVDVDVPGEDAHADNGQPRHHHHHHEAGAHRRLADVLDILRAGRLPAPVEERAARIYRRLAEAEARVHRMSVEDVAFHEVGQVDAIVDIAGAAVGLHLLGVDRAYCSPLPCGRGRIRALHGELPSPSPATMELLRGFPTYAVELDDELVTPTGAAILTTIASFERRPPMMVERVGYGSGRSDFPFPNVLRVVVGETTQQEAHPDGDETTVVQLETNIDDMNPQLYEHVVERLFGAGALDVWTQPAQMKKGRPGTVVSVLAPSERADAIVELLLAETTTIGVRRWPVARATLARRVETFDTTLGPVRVKLVLSPAGVRARPEYDDCKAIADRTGLALGEVMRRVDVEIASSLNGRPQ